MSPTHKALIKEAHKRHFPIFPVGRRSSFTECFTIQYGNLYLWYDTSDTSTHMVHEEMLAQEILPAGEMLREALARLN